MKCADESTAIGDQPEVDKRWHGSPRRQSPSSSRLDSITKGGDKDVTTRKTDRARVDKPDTTISPPGLRRRMKMAKKNEEIYETPRPPSIYFIRFTRQSYLSELFYPAPVRRVSTLCFQCCRASAALYHRAASAVVHHF